jgi:hypothetical protein
MKIFNILLNICFPYYNFVILIYTKTSGFTSMFYFVVPISSLTNLGCDSISRCCIFNISFYGARIASSFSYCWIPFGFFILTPPFEVLWYL